MFVETRSIQRHPSVAKVESRDQYETAYRDWHTRTSYADAVAEHRRTSPSWQRHRARMRAMRAKRDALREIEATRLALTGRCLDA